MKNREGEPKGLDLVCKPSPFKKKKLGYKPVKTSLIIPYSEIESVCVLFMSCYITIVLIILPSGEMASKTQTFAIFSI